ncbi:MAG: DEAD/DEAH box helicase [Bacteroidota bacterium]
MSASSAFELLHRSIQRWIWRSGWTELRDLQERAIPAILAEDRDVVLAAATASGKTEAAFLPVLSLLAERDRGEEVEGFRALYLSPLKALINDQFDRLRLMGEAAGVPVHRWHGDVPQSQKNRARQHPSGVLLITPESLEALLMRDGLQARRLFGEVRFLIVDELHAFIGTERGRQLQSLLHRVDLASRRTRPRIALSATLGDMPLAADFLRPGRTEPAVIIEGQEGQSELRLQVRGYTGSPPKIPTNDTPTDDTPTHDASTLERIATHIFTHLRGQDNLVFANSRNRVEQLADALHERAQRLGVPHEFYPHHGNLSKEIREQAEAQLKSGRPATAVCTSTLELGIDIGSVQSIAQIGPPPAVASLRQRLGRSGRRAGEPAVLRVYIAEPPLSRDARPDEPLRLRLVQTVAMIELLLARWYEPPRPEALHLSTLVQQLLSVITQLGGARADALYDALCRRGPFRSVTPTLFADVLRSLDRREVLQQSPGDGSLLLGPEGERLTSQYSFYAAFSTEEEYRLVCDGKTLGTLPVTHAVAPGMHLVFAGKRWKILDVSPRESRITVAASPAGTAPSFGGDAGHLHAHVAHTMRALYRREDAPRYLDAPARELLAQGRRQFEALKLGRHWAIDAGTQTLVFPWLGTPGLNALALALTDLGLSVETNRIHLSVDAEPAIVRGALTRLAAEPPPSPARLAAVAPPRETAKHHTLLDAPLLHADYASAHLDVPAAWQWLLARGRAS